MWDNLKITGEVGWIAKAILDNSLLVITDGSYMKKLYPNLNSAAFILECTEVQGQGNLWAPLLNT
jgi:hypothetical protein